MFIHKVDGINDDLKMETQRDIHQRAMDDLSDAGFERICLNFHLTSIYDYSIFEAFSKVIQKLIPQLPKLENLLNIFIVVSVHFSVAIDAHSAFGLSVMKCSGQKPTAGSTTDNAQARNN